MTKAQGYSKTPFAARAQSQHIDISNSRLAAGLTRRPHLDKVGTPQAAGRFHLPAGPPAAPIERTTRSITLPLSIRLPIGIVFLVHQAANAVEYRASRHRY